MLELDSDAVVPRSQAAGAAQRELWDADTASIQAVGDGEDLARREFERDADVNVVLSRFGAGQPLPQGGTRFQFGVEVDDAVDLKEMYRSVAELTEAWRRAPALFKKAYPTPEAMMAALASDSVDSSLWREEPETPPPVPAVPAGSEPAP